jgi:exonuclease SbcC
LRKAEKNYSDLGERYNTLKNRIEIIKREEQAYKTQLKNIKKKERKEQMIQVDKMKIKFELTKIKEEQDKELQKKKERIHRFKEKIKNNIEEKKIENNLKKKRKYQSALNDKYLIKCILEQINDQQTNKKCYQHEKVKQYYNEFETNKIKQSILKENSARLEYEKNMKKLLAKEKRMKKKCDELLSLEKKYLEQLNQTKEDNLRYIENTSENISKYSYNHFIKKHTRNLNRSMELELYSNNKKGCDYKSAMSSSMKNVKNKSDYRKDNITEYTQSSSISIFKENKSKQNNLKVRINNKSIIKRRNKDSDLKENKRIYKSFDNNNPINKKASNSYINNKNNKDVKNKNVNKMKVKNKVQSYKNFIEKNKNAIKYMTKKK